MGLVYNLNTSSALCFVMSDDKYSLKQILINQCIIPDAHIKLIIFAQHIGEDKRINPLVKELINYNISIVYVCDTLPIDKIVAPNIVYLVVSWADFIFNLFQKSNLFNYVGFVGAGLGIAKQFSSNYSIPLVNKIQDINSLTQNIIKQPKTLLFKMLNGELGDKLVSLSLLSSLKKKYPDYKIDVLLHSERFNTIDGYRVLFKDIVNNCSTNPKDFNELLYEKVFEISAYGIHGGEIQDETINKYIPNSRFQRWARTLELQSPLRGIDFNYKVKELDGDRVNKIFNLNKITKPLVGIFPFSSNKTKDWELSIDLQNSKWQQTIDFLNTLGFCVLVFHYQSLEFKNCINLHHITIAELGYVLNRLKFGIGVEAGLTHFCGLLGIPMMVFIGSSSPLVLRHYKNVRILHKGFCHSCNRFIAPQLNSPCGTLDSNPLSNCISTITVQEVCEEIKDFIQCLKI